MRHNAPLIDFGKEERNGASTADSRRRDGSETRRAARWNAAVAAGAVLVTALLSATLLSLQNRFSASWRAGVADFRWVVLVDGDQVTIDEIGRFLNQSEGAADVTFVSAADSLAYFRQVGDLSTELQGLEQNPFPSAYHVQWNPNVLESDRLTQLLQDVRTFPGVVDVAYDGRTLASLRDARLVYFQVRAALSAALFLGCIALVVLIGRFFFSSAVKRFSFRSFAGRAAVDGLTWAAGVFVASRLVPGVPWPIYFSGLLVGALRYLHALTGEPRP